MSDSSLPARAKLSWDEQGQPLSDSFADVYFSRDNGLAESRFIFLAHNHLPGRFQRLASSATFVIGETGFGTGLNFLACWQLWRQSAPPDARLHFLSVEKYPLARADLEQALRLWPELQPLSEQLLAHYPAVLNRGFHKLNFDAGRVNLTLIIDDAHSGFEQLLESTHPAYCQPRRPVDAWFLDGFAPAKNPDMWQPALFRLVGQLSWKGTTLATFTAAGAVRRGLQEQGFEVEKVPGFGRKREMLRATLAQTAARPSWSEFPHNSFNSPYPLAWMVHSQTPQQRQQHPPACPATNPAANLATTPTTTPGQAVIVGGGLAGSHTAAALARRGWQVTLLERHPRLASEGSGNPQAALYAKLSHRSETLANFNLMALQFALRSYRPFWAASAGGATAIGDRCGVLQLADNDNSERLQAQLVRHFGVQDLFTPLSAAAASTASGVPLEHSGLFFADAGWLDPVALCHELTRHPNIEVRTGVEVLALEPLDGGNWRIQLGQNRAPREDANSSPETSPETSRESSLESNLVVLCTANAIQGFSQTAELPVKPMRGQVSFLAASEASANLKTVLCGDGYMTPARTQLHCLGATFTPDNQDLALWPEEHQQNLATLARQLPALSQALQTSAVQGGRAALRCTTPDYLPMLGPAPRFAEYLEQFQLLRKNARANIPLRGPVWENLYVNVGHGSRGLAYTPLCAELLAARISAEPSAGGRDLETALHPARFWIRNLIRRRL